MLKTTLAAALAASALALSMPAQAQQGGAAAPAVPPTSLSTGALTAYQVDTDTFVTLAASSNLFEIESSRLARALATDESIRAFAQRMIDDHRVAGDRMRAVLEAAGLTVPAEPMLQRHRQMLDTLQTQQAPSFDPAYVQMQAMAHREAVTLFGTYAGSGDNEQLRAFAAETLPILQEHQAMVRALPYSGIDATGATTGGAAPAAPGMEVAPAPRP